MKKYTLAIILMFAAVWAFMLTKCTAPPTSQTEEKASARMMGIAALPAITPDSVVITQGGDTIRYYSDTKTGTYTYKVPYIVISYKNTGTIPPVDTTTPPVTGTTRTWTSQLIPFSDPDFAAPGRGAEQWHDRNDVNLGYTPLDVYYRFVWTRLEGRTQGSYNWSYFDGLVNAAIQKKQKFSFGVMTVYPDGTVNEGLQTFSQGGLGAYPEYIHNFMQSQSIKDWRTGSTWTPNYNLTFYTDRLRALYDAMNSHIATTSFNGVPYKNVINCIDIRGYGAWGEWHSGYTPNNNVSDYPTGTFPTVASLKRIVDAHTQGFPDFQLQCMIAGFDAMWLNNTKNPNEIAYYLLTQRNNHGLIGWRRDQWGAIDEYLKDYLERNNRTFNGLTFKDSIMVRYKSAPITGEPPAWNPNEYADLERQIRLYGASSFGNGNYGGLGGQSVSRIIASSKAAGYRIAVTGGTIVSGTNGRITASISNTGIAPIYEDWQMSYELREGTTVKWLGTSKFKVKQFLPGSISFTDNFPNIPTGNYTLVVRFTEINGYRAPLALAQKNRNSDGSYTLIP